MKNLQTILLGLVIALGFIYIAYNETRIAEAEMRLESLDRDSLEFKGDIDYLTNIRIEPMASRISKLEESHGRLVDVSFKADEEIAKIVDSNTGQLVLVGEFMVDVSKGFRILEDGMISDEAFANHVKSIHDNLH